MENFELLFLGTGAADWAWHPAEEVRYDTSGAIRRTSSLLLDGKYLIDPAPEAYFFASEVLKLDLSGLQGIFLTHRHKDHLCYESLKKFIEAADEPVRFYCHETTVPYLELDDDMQKRLIICPVKAGQTVEVGDMKVLILSANHTGYAPGEVPVHYVFEKGDKRFLYGLDGGWYTCDTWDILLETKLDMAVVDGTVGGAKTDYRICSHNTLAMIELLVASMKECSILKEDSRIVLSHLARTLHGPNEDYRDWTVAQDGMRLVI